MALRCMMNCFMPVILALEKHD